MRVKVESEGGFQVLADRERAFDRIGVDRFKRQAGWQACVSGKNNRLDPYETPKSGWKGCASLTVHERERLTNAGEYGKIECPRNNAYGRLRREDGNVYGYFHARTYWRLVSND